MKREDDYRLAAYLIREAAQQLDLATNAIGRRTQDRRVIERRERLIIDLLRRTEIPETRIAKMLGMHRNSIQQIERRHFARTGERVRAAHVRL
ncbi:hypothetical protein IMF23_00115 [Chelatococcus daeguensis]|uniref:Uncharacterized protein n=1 Tax=Chelatococcus sambhunathii TaxID=363953 RepID=A0ABM9UBC2_9HYPH|nr:MULTISPECIES: hypothetical protein [Chelatococcus]KZE34131.1 hypothetical protein AVW15_17610 [Chelatococcus daeguensis]MBM3081833.1 hypothetical protein [Chelatococcus daeguensis]CUA90865.1 hypothetical protein Ga0061061_11621 [Chelatococcus sambhunathii]